MLTKIVDTSDNHQVGDTYTLDGTTYTITEIETAGDLTRLWLK